MESHKQQLKITCTHTLEPPSFFFTIAKYQYRFWFRWKYKWPIHNVYCQQLATLTPFIHQLQWNHLEEITWLSTNQNTQHILHTVTRLKWRKWRHRHHITTYLTSKYFIVNILLLLRFLPITLNCIHLLSFQDHFYTISLPFISFSVIQYLQYHI